MERKINWAILAPGNIANSMATAMNGICKSTDYRNKIKDGATLPADSEIFYGKDAYMLIARLNTLLKDNTAPIPYNITKYKIVAEECIHKPSWEKIANSVVAKITEAVKNEGLQVVMSENMLLTEEQYKNASQLSKDYTAEVFEIIGLAITAAAGVIASIYTAGAASAITALAVAEIGAIIGYSTAAAATAMVAIAGSAGIGEMAETIKRLEETPRELANKGYYPINKLTLSGRISADQHANATLIGMFEGIHEKWERGFALGSRDPGLKLLGSDANFYISGGRLTNFTQKDRDTNSKQNAFYVDESIVTLNTPDFDDIQTIAKHYLTKPSVISIVASKKTIEENKDYLNSLGEFKAY